MQQAKSGRIRKNAIYSILSFPHKIYVWAYTKFWRKRGYKDITCTIYPSNLFQAQKLVTMLTQQEIDKELQEIEQEELNCPTPTGRPIMSSEIDYIHSVVQNVLKQHMRKRVK